ncbi:MAG: glycoside hydrolase family 3 C-terminal domain-containing protein [Bacteroidales bacterium]|nr:glycoside hydrolase family 3 C-terminal domain-containing protein [Bacteroidales bacterium]
MKKRVAINYTTEKKQSSRFFQLAFKSALLFSFLFFVFLTSCQRTTNKQDKMTKAYLMAHLTTKEKIDLLGGVNMSTKPIPRLGIPSIRMDDGPVGARWGRSTSFPSGIALASTWDTALVRKIGQGIGREVRGKGRNIILGPNVNIARNPLNGRTFEGFGEDPFLTSQMGVSYILGVQDEGVGTTVKHFVANSQEFNRMSIDEKIDERTLREIYFPAFKAAVQRAHSLAIMTAYNKVNGEFCSANHFLLNEVLRKEWHYDGLIMSDWGGVHYAFPTVNNALDLEMPFGTYLNEKTLLPALDSGKVKIATINDKVDHILNAAYRLKVLPTMAYPQHLIDTLINSKETQKDALQAAIEAIVLLKNERHVLPIEGNKKLHIAVIGPDADFARAVGGGSAEVHPIFAISPLSALQNALKGKAVIDYAPGILFQYPQPIAPAFFYQNDGVTQGLKAEFFHNDSLEGKPVVTTATQIDYRQGAAQVTPVATNPDFKGKFSVRWVGKIKAPVSGLYTFGFHSGGKSVLYLNDKEVLTSGDRHYWEGGDPNNVYKVKLEKGKMYDIKVEYHGRVPYNPDMGVSLMLTLNWHYPQDVSIAKAVAAARKADIALVFAGTSSYFEHEGSDRKNLELPENQNELIRKVAAANKNTVVILISGAPIAVDNWINHVPAVLETWFDGEFIGKAIADVLLGYSNPSGKLPVTFPKSMKQEPEAVQHYADNDTLITYSDGIYVGYRYFETKNIKPSFPFGFGLSYTTFKYSDLKLVQDTTDGKRQAEVTYTITNTGKRTGAEVSQVYVHENNPKIDRPFKELKGFSRVDLQPGESKTVHMTLDKMAFEYFDPQKKTWKVDHAVFDIMVGSSSEEILLTGSLNWK